MWLFFFWFSVKLLRIGFAEASSSTLHHVSLKLDIWRHFGRFQMRATVKRNLVFFFASIV